MATTNLITDQYVNIEVPLASVSDRIIARVIDMSIIYVYAIGVGFFIAYIDSLIDLAGTDLGYVLFYILSLPAIFYSFIFETFNGGKTPGKRCMHIKVVMENGQTPTPLAAFMRWIMIMIDIYTCCVGILSIAITKRNRRIGDFAAGTVVIKEYEYALPIERLENQANALRQYQPAYFQAQQLTYGQIEVIKKTLTTGNDDRERLLDELAEKVRRIANVKPRESTSEDFLQRIVSDYNYYIAEMI